MLHIKKVMGVLLTTAAVTILLSGCYKDRTIVSETGDEITRTVSFVNDIIPLFNSSCNSSGCHNNGGKAPDLSSANAFTSLTNGNYINTSDPSNSELYLWMTGKRGIPMPVSGVNKEYNALILAWIKQGGSNN